MTGVLLSSLPDVALLPDAALVLDAQGRVLSASPPAAAMFGVDPAGRELAGLIPDPARFWEAVADVGADAVTTLIPLTGRRANGVPFALDVCVRVLADGALVCVLRELDRQAPGTLDAAFDAMPIGMALFNTDGEYLRVNASLCALLGRTGDDLVGTRDQELTHPDDRQSDLDAAGRVLDGEIDTWQCEKRFVRPDGAIVWTLANLTFLRDESGRPLCWVGQFQDVTELRRMASRDPLTDALNRRAFDLELERATDASLLVLDLDGFKDINDAHGHHAGDELLRRTADAIRGRLRRDDVLARLGGDEFAVLLPHCDAGRAMLVANDLAALIAGQRFVFDGVERSVTASVGVAAVRGADETVSAADRAMYAAKAVGGNSVRCAH
jgi:diguanylate cyclase (GGDEF)-like protein/PAS domain S-box-containing protein